MNYKKGAIVSFQQEYRFLSNFYACIVEDEYGISYSSVEHFYQASKTLDRSVRLIVADIHNPSDTKTYAHEKIQPNPEIFREDFHDVKVQIMANGLKQKFTKNEVLMKKLIETDGYLLVEGNYWKDNFWGVDFKTGIGENKLGMLLMMLREKLLAI
jgi:ribA/ribD-fused uncharacterized protein